VLAETENVRARGRRDTENARQFGIQGFAKQACPAPLPPESPPLCALRLHMRLRLPLRGRVPVPVPDEDGRLWAGAVDHCG
jgi:hypothetical protein